MESERRKKVQELFDAAQQQPADKRAEFLRQECPDDLEILDEVESLLKAAETRDQFPNGSPLSSTVERALKAGDKLENFEVLAFIGRGGMGEVYRARDLRLKREVAIKALPPGFARDRERIARFEREARAASALNHPNIATVYQTCSEGGRDFIVMEFIAGHTLRQLIGKRGIPVAKALRYAVEIADAVAAAHLAGIVHRDLKPNNVMVGERGHIKVLDFGLAKALPFATEPGQDPTAVRTLTQEGFVVGTYPYMSPEQASGRPVDTRSDIFSFGCMLYEMLTGRAAFLRDNPVETLTAIVQSDPRPLRELVPSIPTHLDRIQSGCLRKDPRERWQSMGDVKDLLESELRDLDAGAPQEARRKGRWSVASLAAGVLFGALLAVGAMWLREGRRAAELTEPPITMLTADAGLSAYPALSKDGSILAFASDRSRDGNLDIWVQQIGSGDPIRLTHWPSDETDPDVSPDGTRVAFRSEKDGGGIYVASTLGGAPPVLIAPEGRNPRFSPDGRFLAYWVGREGPGYLPDSAHVYSIPSGGGQAQRLDSGFAAGFYPIWSPRGDALIALARKESTGAVANSLDWWILPLDSRPPHRTGAVRLIGDVGISPPRGLFNPIALLWLDEPARVLFSGSIGDATNVWELKLNGNLAATGKPQRVTAGASYETQASFARLPTGETRFAYSSLTLNFDVWALPLDLERGIVKGELSRITNDASYEAWPTLNHDGTLMAFSSLQANYWAIRTIDLSTRQERTILTSIDPLTNPVFSGDGQFIIYSDLTDGIFKISSKGGTAQTLCLGCGTPDDTDLTGSRVLMEPIEPPDDLRVLEPGSSSPVTFVPAQESLSRGAWTSDMTWVAFQVAVPGSANVQIFAANVAGGRRPKRDAWVAITDGKSPDRLPTWSPSGKVLYFLSERDGFRCLWAQRLVPDSKKPLGEPLGVMHFHNARRSLKRLGSRTGEIGLSAAGNVAVFTIGELTGNIWLRKEKR